MGFLKLLNNWVSSTVDQSGPKNPIFLIFPSFFNQILFFYIFHSFTSVFDAWFEDLYVLIFLRLVLFDQVLVAMKLEALEIDPLWNSMVPM